MSFEFWMVNIENESSLPRNWAHQILELANNESRTVSLDGSDPSSREPKGGDPVDYCVVDGEKIRENLPWLFDLYRDRFLDIATSLTGRDLEISSEIRSAININVVSGRGGRYEWHVDNNPITALLFANTLYASDGGELMFRPEEGGNITFSPNIGNLAIFDARSCPHAVAPVLSNVIRLSVPMNYFEANQTHVERSKANVTDYIFGNKES